MPVDFQQDDLPDVLTRHGYDRTQRTFFILEGVTMYLPEEAARETLRFVGAHPPGSGIVFDFAYRAMIAAPTSPEAQQQMSPERMREQQRLSAYHLAEAVVAS